jgi:hypothetical protein
VWSRCYADASSWPEWNREISAASLEGPFERGSRARVKFRTGLRLRFTLVEVEPERVFTDEARLPGARMGHRHEIERTDEGVRLTNTIYIDGSLSWLWSRLIGRRARRVLPDAQRRIVELASRGS